MARNLNLLIALLVTVFFTFIVGDAFTAWFNAKFNLDPLTVIIIFSVAVLVAGKQLLRYIKL